MAARHARFLCLFLGALGAAGCGQARSEVGEQPGAGDGGRTAYAGNGPTTAGAPGQDDYTRIAGCKAARNCELQTVTGEVQLKPTPDEIRCALVALRDGTPGFILASSQLASGIGSSGSGDGYLVHPGRTVDSFYWFSSSSSGSSGSLVSPPHCELWPAEHYDACIAALDAATVNPDGGTAATTYSLNDCGVATNCTSTPGTCP